MIDSAFFPNTVSSYYWSGSTCAPNSGSAWHVDFNYGDVYDRNKTSNSYVRCVRGGPSGSFDSLIINGDGTVTDSSTGLMWQQNTVPGTIWEGAFSYSESLTLAGYDDWRLPNHKELQSIVDYGAYDPAIGSDFFPNSESSSYWASSTYVGSPSLTWAVFFYYGYLIGSSKTSINYLRCVRGGQNRLLGHLVISSPRQGSTWVGGESEIITWDTQGIAGNVKISISRQGGKDGTFTDIAASTANDGSYNWTVTGPGSVNCVLKIEPLIDTSKGTTQGLFTIDEPSAPEATTGSATSVTSTSATLNGTVTPNGASTTYYFQYGTTTSTALQRRAQRRSRAERRLSECGHNGSYRQYRLSLQAGGHKQCGNK